MPLDPYASCPCGSGKKFKWCCSGYFAQVEKAFDLDRQGQHEAALHTMQELTTGHADQPAVWGYYAQFLYNVGQMQQAEADRNRMVEQAEEALSAALKLNPNFGMAHFLRGMFRENEGEVLGALMLYRKAAEAYDPDAHDQLTQVYERVFRLELLMLNRPVAARAALARAVHLQPADPELREQFEVLFGAESRLPACARNPYSFRPTAKPVSPAAATGKLSDARKGYEELTKATPGDPAAWFNLGLVLAWLGEQPKAVEALLKSVELETDDRRAEEAGALVEVLRCGHGMENDADYLEHGFYIPIRDPRPVEGLLREWDAAHKLLGVQANQETGAISAMVVEELPSLLAVGSTTLAKVVSKLSIAQGLMRVWHSNRELVAKVADDIRGRLNLAVEQPQETTTPVNFADVALEALAYPTQTSDLSAAEDKLRAHAKKFFEDVWAHRPRRSLNGVTPLDAVGSSLLRKRVFGVVRFVEDCLAGMVPHKRVGNQTFPVEVYNFDQLRHKLGLEYITADPPKVDVPADPAPAAAPAGHPPVSTGGSPPKREIPAMNAADLAGLDVAGLTGDELEQAFRTALKLDARELAVAFSQAGVGRPADPAKPDRYPYFACLITGAISEGDSAKALAAAEAGAAHDADHNGGKRANDYGLRKAQLYAKLKRPDDAAAEFDRLIERSPDEGKFYTAAAEAMLSARNGPKALHFAEKGLARARQAGNRDLEGHCQELAGAAKKLG